MSKYRVDTQFDSIKDSEQCGSLDEAWESAFGILKRGKEKVLAIRRNNEIIADEKQISEAYSKQDKTQKF